MEGFGGSTGVSKGYVDRAIAQSTAVVELALSITTSGVVSAASGKAYQIGKLVLINLDISMTGSATSDWVNVATVSKYPKDTVTSNALPDQSAAGAPVRVRVRNDNGAIQLFYGGSGNYHIHVVYPTT